LFFKINIYPKSIVFTTCYWSNGSNL